MCFGSNFNNSTVFFSFTLFFFFPLFTLFLLEFAFLLKQIFGSLLFLAPSTAARVSVSHSLNKMHDTTTTTTNSRIQEYYCNRINQFSSFYFNKKGGIYRRGTKYSADFKQRIIRSVLEAAAQGFPRGWSQRISTQYRVSPAYLSKVKARVEEMDSPPSLSETVELYYGSYQGMISVHSTIDS
jgi:hypothetical protein